MRALFPLVIFSLSAFCVYSQSDSIHKVEPNNKPDTGKHKPLAFDISCDAGIGLPAGKFSVNYFNYLASTGNAGSAGFRGEGGFAMPNISGGILAEIPYKHSYWGIAANLGYYLNGFNMGSYAGGYSYNTPAYYNTFTIMPGAFVLLEGEKVSFEARALLGAMLSRSPELFYTGDSISPDFKNSTLDTSIIWKETKPVTAVAFAFEVGASLRFKISNKVYALLNLSYLQAYPTFNTETDLVEKGIFNANYVHIYCPVSLFDASAGIGYRFGR